MALRPRDETDARRRALALAILRTALVTTLVMNLSRSDRTVSRRLTHGSHVTALQNGADGFPAMLAAIRTAQHSVAFETYIYRPGAIGRGMSHALAQFQAAFSDNWMKMTGRVLRGRRTSLTCRMRARCRRSRSSHRRPAEARACT